jgi:hypothetical protein
MTRIIGEITLIMYCHQSISVIRPNPRNLGSDKREEKRRGECSAPNA